MVVWNGKYFSNCAVPGVWSILHVLVGEYPGTEEWEKGDETALLTVTLRVGVKPPVLGIFCAQDCKWSTELFWTPYSY